MKTSTAEAIYNAGQQADIEVEIRHDYSGRGMYGKQTAAVVLDNTADLYVLVAHATKVAIENAGFDDFVEDLNWRMDSMGKGIVVY